ncbi:cytochrome c oxidase subunit 8B, mitochondrial-like [Saccopteryx bilineata]|uniref:cytochrome c oxidase subunit 8B, mitochondrial-like n=1 Tax=Saccopteryx bilineata TaxID=59482 RepID=UPI00338F5B75
MPEQAEGTQSRTGLRELGPATMKLAPAIRLLQAPLRGCVVPKAHISAKPAKSPTSAPEQATALVVTFISFMVPAGWVLSHLDSYKKSSSA